MQGVFGERFDRLVTQRLGLPEGSSVSMVAKALPSVDLDEVQAQTDGSPELDLETLRTYEAYFEAAPGVIFIRAEAPDGSSFCRAIPFDQELEQALREA